MDAEIFRVARPVDLMAIYRYFIEVCSTYYLIFCLKSMASVFWAFTFRRHFLNYDKVM